MMTIKKRIIVVKIKDNKAKKWEPKKKVIAKGVESYKINLEQKKSTLDADIQDEYLIVQLQVSKGSP